MRKQNETPIETAISAARLVIEGYIESRAQIEQLYADRTTAIEFGNVEALMKVGAEIEIRNHRLPKELDKARQAIGAIYTVAADAERNLAEEKRGRRKGILEKVTVVLAELSQIEDVAYTKFVTKAQPIGIWEPRFGSVANLIDGSPGDIYALTGDARYAIPLSERLGAEVKEHEARAVELAGRQVDSNGDLAAALETVVREVTPAAVKAVEAA